VKFRHSPNSLSAVSFVTQEQKNPFTQELTGVKIDKWEEIPHTVAQGLEELQDRLDKLEAVFSQIGGADKMLAIFEWMAKAEEKKGLKPPKEEPAPMLPIDQAKKKGGRPKKAV